eukprot:CAMPEP_0173210036 /NCGR_PEP_ID=MMETSP1141-20130122/23437_1 /TAXON_ID=483371 /ORGANISM="non described non described, Strain CCMP2298" /LENGTH=94 /DNA_ID=CAMNT_0014136731 /DNA_START=443 /DNA_END=727 /DNA_ORIENTATION=+
MSPLLLHRAGHLLLRGARDLLGGYEGHFHALELGAEVDVKGEHVARLDALALGGLFKHAHLGGAQAEQVSPKLLRRHARGPLYGLQRQHLSLIE